MTSGTPAAAGSAPASWPAGGLEAVLTCPVCGSPRRRVLYEHLTDRLFGAPGEWTLWRCGGCPTAYLDPRPTAETVGLAYADYFWHEPPEDREAPPDGAAEWARRALRNGYLQRALGYEAEPSSRALGAIAAHLPAAPAALRRWVRHLPHDSPRPRLLDVGCASGEFMLQMRALGWEVHGMDIDGAALEQARAAGLSVVEGTLESPAGVAAAGGFDALTLAHVIEHLPDPVAALRRARDLLRPGGLLWVATPNLRSLAHRMFGRDWLSLDPPRHLVLFSAGSLLAAFEAAGLERIEQPAPVRNLLSVAEQSAELAGVPTPRVKGALAQEIAVRRPALAEELVVLGRRP
jgi:SAM-dependent methyltransferase